MKRILSLLIIITIVFIGCTQKKAENNATTISKESLADSVMTIEKYCNMDFELATILMENYYDKLKDKKYEEVKDLYHNFLEKKDATYKKYGVIDKQKTAIWAKQNKKELKTYRSEHSEINYYEKYPNFKEANILMYNLARSEYNLKQTKK